jgi:hypothetical protein
VRSRDYLRLVAYRLRDLPWRTRKELVSDLRAHLGEVPAGEDLVEKLGPPERYAADLRASAGLGQHHGPVACLRARRPRNLAIVAAVIAVGGLVIAAVVWVQSYQPIVFGDGSFFPANSQTSPAGDSVSVTYRDGRPFQLGITIRNSGAFSVRILGGPMPEPHAIYPFSARLLVSGSLRNGGVHGPFTTFRPFDLNPGDGRLLLLRGVYANCRFYSGGTGEIIKDFQVRFRFFWRTTTARIPLPEELAIEIPKGRRCVGQ